MKKGFTMIELIFVIVILGILASVAIPRLAATKADAEISAAVANLRTLISDANAYYTVKGEFPTGANGKITTKWNEITNVPLTNAANAVSDSQNTAMLKVGNQDCINFLIVNSNGNTPAYIVIVKNKENKNSGVCKQVLESEPLKPYLTSTLAGVKNSGNAFGAIAIGSSISIYETGTTATQSRN